MPIPFPYSLKLRTYSEFIEVSKILDKEYGTKSYLLQTSLESLNKRFLKRDMNYAIQEIVDFLFKNQNKVYSNEDWLTDRHLEKINSFSYLLEDFKSNNFKIKHPISMKYFGKERWVIHPGNSRLFFKDLVKDTVNVFITDFTGNLKEDYNMNFQNIEDGNFDVKGLYFFCDTTKGRELDKVPGKMAEYIEGRNITYAELLPDIPKVLGDPRLYDPPKVYELKNNIVYVDGKEVIKYSDKWEFVL